MSSKAKRGMATAQFSDSYPPIMDGVAVVAKEYARHLASQFGPSYVVAPRVPGYVDHEPRVYRYPSIPIPGRDPYRYGMPWLSPTFMYRLNNLSLSLVHAHSPFVAGSLALHVAESQQVPIVASFHSKYLDDVRRMFPQFDLPTEVVRRHIVNFYGRVDQVWVPNKATVETLREYGYDGPIEIVGHGTDIVAPADLKTSRSRAEQFLGLEPGERLLLYVGQITFQKNLDFVLKSLKVLHDRGVRFRFALVGEGYARPELEAMAKEMGLGGITFTGVIQDRELLADILSRTSLLVFPSLYDTAGLVIRESAALGVPSVLLTGSNAAEGVTDGQNGFLCGPDPERYGSRLQQILSDPELLAKVGKGAQATLSRPWSDVVSEVTERYAELIRVSEKTLSA